MIAFLINSLDVRGGTHKQFLKLVQYTEKQKIDFCIVTKKIDLDQTYPEFKQYVDRVRILNEYPKAKHFLGKILRVIRSARELRKLVLDATIINVHDPGFEFFFYAFKEKKIVWQVNDLPYYFHVGVSKSSHDTLKVKLLRNFVRYNTKFVDEIVVNVSKNAERIRSCFHRDAHVYYCGIEPVNIRRNIDDTQERFANKKIHILSSGVFFPYRNYETQVLVVNKLRERGIDANLQIIGSTSLNPQYALKIQSMIEEKGLADYIRICGQVDEEQFKQLHQDADIFVFINIDQSWGLAVFEAMSCGLPVIVSNSVGATEILHDRVDSIFVNPTDVDEIVRNIEKLMDSKELYDKMSEKSSQFHSDYTWDNAYCSRMFNLIAKYNK